MTTPALSMPEEVTARGGPLSASDLHRLGRLARLPLAWSATRRRRRLLLLVLAAPGFVLVTATPFHRAFALLVVGAALLALAFAFRWRSEPVFARAEAAELWPPSPTPKDALHA